MKNFIAIPRLTSISFNKKKYFNLKYIPLTLFLALPIQANAEAIKTALAISLFSGAIIEMSKAPLTGLMKSAPTIESLKKDIDEGSKIVEDIWSGNTYEKVEDKIRFISGDRSGGSLIINGGNRGLTGGGWRFNTPKLEKLH